MDPGAVLGTRTSRGGFGKEPRPRHRRPARFALGGLAAALCVAAAIAGGLALGNGLRASQGRVAAIPGTPHRYGLDGQATWAAGARPAPQITTLADQSGHHFSLASLHGRTVAMVFFDSHCKQECPLEGHALAAAERGLPAAQRPVLVAVSVNPQDTQASVRQAIRSWGLAGVAPWYWLMGTHRQLAAAWRAYHIYVGPKVNGDIAHTEAVYLIDRRGFERSAYLYPFAPNFVTHDLRSLAAPRE